MANHLPTAQRATRNRMFKESLITLQRLKGKPRMSWLRDLFALDEQHQVLLGRNIKSRTHQKTKHTIGRENFQRCKAETM
ncbi:hypothetical protein MKW98_025281 [Papaver atlanticum]|uniref:Uncharacterized protein n=1 Tax=Papaver atlanticum TaxID=357466 RepID=A0AAD4X7S9_9MAGN|nr:hypothetical protein MKW98_025281 [Papaver atlanticum]